MKLSVCTNFQNDFLDVIKGRNSISEVYGKLPTDLLGGGRPSYMVPCITKRKLEELISELHKLGIDFNYLLNSTCLGNMESTRSGYKKIRILLDWLSDISVDALTVSLPFLAEMIYKNYPNFNIKVSAFAKVTTLQQAQYWQDLGAKLITLEPQTMNREFNRLRHITEHLQTDIQLIVNQGCLFSCSNLGHHANTFSHASQSGHRLKGFIIDYCSMRCRYMKLLDKVNFIRADWIRPEDLCEYEKIGIKHFKVIQRNWSTEKLARIVSAYDKGYYNGNLADLTEFLFGGNHLISKKRMFKYFFKPNHIRFNDLIKIYNNISEACKSVEINNRELDGFIEIFKKESCLEKDCDDCRYCHEIAQKTVKTSGVFNADCIKKNIDWLISREDL